MTTISWQQIDSNNNGYVDGNEMEVAKENGITNIWNNMSKADFESNISKEEKLKGLSEMFAPKPEPFQSPNYILVTIGNIDREEYEQKLKNQYAEAILHLNCKYETLKKEEKRLYDEFRQKFGILEGLGYEIKDDLFNTAFCEVALSICTFGKYKHSYERTEKHNEYRLYLSKLDELAKEIRECYYQLKDSAGWYNNL